jgi:diacylglycerol kinase family enzyme
MSLPLVIVNPASADGATRENWPRMASDLRTHFGTLRSNLPENAGDGRHLASAAAKKGTKLIIAQAATARSRKWPMASSIQQDCELAVLPSGTGGTFADPRLVNQHCRRPRARCGMHAAE